MTNSRMPSPFEIGGAIGNNISGAFRQSRDISAIDQILQDASNDPDAMDNAMRSIISKVSPERQQQAYELLKGKQQQILQRNTQNEQVRIAEQIEKGNPGSSMHKMLADIYRSTLPVEQKEKMIKSLSGSVPFRAEQQNRLQLDSVLKRYNSRIKEIDAAIKNARYDERAPLENQKKALQDERDLLLNFQALNKEEIDQEQSDFDEIPNGNGKKLDKETAKKFLKLAGDDYDKAMENARKKGYKF